MNKGTRVVLVWALAAAMLMMAGCKKAETTEATATVATTETTATEATTETTATTATVASESTGVPECDAYLAAVDKYMACDKIPQAARDAQKQARDQMRSGWASWASLPDDARKMAQDTAKSSCTTALNSLKVAANASGCPVE